MSQENVESRLGRAFEAYNRGDLGMLLSLTWTRIARHMPTGALPGLSDVGSRA